MISHNKLVQGVKVPILWPKEQWTLNYNFLLADGCLRYTNHRSMAQIQYCRNDASLTYDDPTGNGLPAN